MRNQSVRMIFLQAILLIVFSWFFYVGTNANLATGFFFGGLVALVPQVIFSLIIFNSFDAGAISLSNGRVLFAELLKVVSSLIGFAAIFIISQPIEPIIVFAGFLFGLVLHLACIFFELESSLARSKKLWIFDGR